MNAEVRIGRNNLEVRSRRLEVGRSQKMQVRSQKCMCVSLFLCYSLSVV